MKRSNKIRLYEISVSEFGRYSYGGDCTISKGQKSNPTVTIQIDEDFIKDINPQNASLYLKSDGLYTFIPYECGEDMKVESARLYVKMWTALTLFALKKQINPKDLFSLVLHCKKNRENGPEIVLRKWEKNNGKIDFDVLELIEKAQKYKPEDKIHEWVQKQTNISISVQPCDNI